MNYTGFLSGRYAIRRDAWNDVAIEIDYHPAHTYNVDRMVDAIKRSLDYFTKNFGPYQHKQVRIVEFPRYERVAMSLAAMIPYSESIGFIARVDEKDRADVDFLFTARRTRSHTNGGRTRSSAPTCRVARSFPRRFANIRR